MWRVRLCSRKAGDGEKRPGPWARARAQVERGVCLEKKGMGFFIIKKRRDCSILSFSLFILIFLE